MLIVDISAWPDLSRAGRMGGTLPQLQVYTGIQAIYNFCCVLEMRIV